MQLCHCWHGDDANHSLYVRVAGLFRLPSWEALKSVVSDSAHKCLLSSPIIEFMDLACLCLPSVCSSCVYLQQLPGQCPYIM